MPPGGVRGLHRRIHPGPTTNAVAEMAKKHHMYVICPIREQAGEQQYNTAVLIDRQGQIAGRYRKVFVYWGEGLHVSREGVQAYTTDFGRIGILTCFDLNFCRVVAPGGPVGCGCRVLAQRLRGRLPLERLCHGLQLLRGSRRRRKYHRLPRARRWKRLRNPGPNRSSPRWTWTGPSSTPNFNEQKVKKLLDEHQGEVEQRALLSDGVLVSAQGNQAAGSRPRLVRTVSHRDAAAVSAPQPAADQ